jgi:hypothetical protein
MYCCIRNVYYVWKTDQISPKFTYLIVHAYYAKTLLKKLSSLLAEKWEKPYSVVCGYVNAQMSIAVVRATHLCLRGSRIPTSQMIIEFYFKSPVASIPI